MKCDIVSARRLLYSGEITRCVVTGTGGELGIYPRHAPLMTTLQAGEVRLWDSDDRERTFIIDEAAAKQAKAEAERELQTRSGKMDIAEAQAKLAEAVAQLRALERLRRQLKRK